jgi:hypothetical protein
MSYLTGFWTSSQEDPGCLLFTNKDFGNCGYLEAGGWCVPIIWSMCFSSRDVNVLLTPKPEWSDPDVPQYGASCDASIDQALQNLERRMPSLIRIVPEHTQDACALFVKRLRQSSEHYVHMNISLLLESEDDPGDQSWKKYWSDLLDGLDTPVDHIRSGLVGRVLGLGLPSGWKYLCHWAMSNGSLQEIRSPKLPLYRVVGAEDIRALSAWQA